jgi:hypothetical protein
MSSKHAHAGMENDLTGGEWDIFRRGACTDAESGRMSRHLLIDGRFIQHWVVMYRSRVAVREDTTLVLRT